MTAVVPLSRHLSTAKKLQVLVSSLQKPAYIQQNSAFSEDLCCGILDKNPDINTLKKLHSKIFIDQNFHSNPSLSIKLMRSYAVCRKPECARHIFDEISNKNVVFFNVMIRSYMNNQLYSDALLLFKSMSAYGTSPDNYTYPCVLKACSGSENLRLGSQIHALVIQVGLDSNLFIGNGLIAMYGKCSFLIEARRIFNEMPRRDVVSYNSLVAGFAQNGLFDNSLDVCREMDLLGLKSDAGTMASLSPAVSNTSRENVSFVEKMFSNLTKKNLVSYNVMISVYVNNSMSSKAIDLFLAMEGDKIEPDSVTFASVLPACGDLSALLVGRKIHEFVERKNLLPNLALENALMDMYAKCGSLIDSRKVFDEMQFRDVVSWTSMISAYGMNGQGRDAVSLFKKMTDSGLTPDSIAFVTVLSACSHAGLLEEGRFFLKLMSEKYSINSRIEHFACMVDLLGRSGKVEEAYTFIKKMPIEPNERVWGALLSACRVYSNMEIGIVAADSLFKLVPEQCGYYVLLSNIYAKACKWEDVTKVRHIMKSKGIKKVPGISSFELNGQVHTFLACDKSHPRSGEIYEELDVLVGKMKEMGYVPEKDFALHDVEEEEKEFHLAVHSEKLAIVFGILSTEPGTMIRITKNLRICGDCHVAMKLISQISKREIVVRDTNRFHHFRDGICSCGDYW